MKEIKLLGMVFYIAAIVLDVSAIIAFSSGNNNSIGSICLSLGSAFLCLGIVFSRKQSDGNDDRNQK